MLKALIFDFYGVIYSNFDWEAINQRIYSNENKANEFRELIHRANTGKITNSELLGSTSRLAHDDTHPENLAVKREPSINYSALVFVESLRENYKTGLLSNGSHSHINEALDPMGGAQKYFDVVISSSDTKFIKPAKEAFMNMVDELGESTENTLVVDDSPRHIEGAKGAGLKTIRFNDMEQLRVDLKKFGVQ